MGCLVGWLVTSCCGASLPSLPAVAVYKRPFWEKSPSPTGRLEDMGPVANLFPADIGRRPYNTRIHGGFAH